MDYSALDLIPLPVLVIDENYRVVFLNKKAKEIYGEVEGECYEVTHSFTQPCYLEQTHPCPVKVIKERGVESYQTVHIHRISGEEVYFYIIACYHKESKTYVEVHVELSDILKALESSQLSSELLLSSGPMVFFLWENSPGWPVKLVSPNVSGLMGYSAEEFTEGKVKYADIIHKDDIDRVSKEVKTYTERHASSWTHEDYRIVTKDGRVKWVLDHTIPIKDERGNITGYYGYVIDITEKHEKEEIFRNLSDASPVGIFLRQGKKFLYVNKALSEITGYSIEELLELDDVLKVIYPKDRKKVRDVIFKRDVGIKGIERYEVRIKRRDGKVRWVQISSETTFYRGFPAGIGVVMDITERKVAELKLKKLALYDKLTQIYNRYALEEFFAKEIAKAERYKIPFSVVFFDVDDFKLINDTYGHKMGDTVLKKLASLIKRHIRKSDILGRYGGEEFLLILPMEKNPITTAEKLRKLVETAVFEKIKVTISLGATTYREGDTMDTILRRVDTALYRAKREGKNRCVYNV